MRGPAILFLFPFLFTSLNAGTPADISATAGPVFPVRGINRIVTTGYGFTGTVQINVNDNISVAIRGGYNHWNFSSSLINASLAASGSPAGYDVRGSLEAFPLMAGARVTFNGASLRPYVGFTGGPCFLYWRFSGTSTAYNSAISRLWTEPAASVEAGVIFALSSGVWLDAGLWYTAFANAKDRVEPADAWGRKIIMENTAALLAVQIGVRVEL